MGCFQLGTYEAYRLGPCNMALATNDELACTLLLEELNNVGLCACTSSEILMRIPGCKLPDGGSL